MPWRGESMIFKDVDFGDGDIRDVTIQPFPVIPLTPEQQAKRDNEDEDYRAYQIKERAEKGLKECLMLHWDIRYYRELTLGKSHDNAHQIGRQVAERLKPLIEAMLDRVEGYQKWSEQYPDGDLDYAEKLNKTRTDRIVRILRPRREEAIQAFVDKYPNNNIVGGRVYEPKRRPRPS